MAEREHDSDRRAGHGEDTLSAISRGASLAAIRMGALDQARALFGPEAALQIEEVRDIYTSIPRRGEDGPQFTATVIVRRTDAGEMWIPPASQEGT